MPHPSILVPLVRTCVLGSVLALGIAPSPAAAQAAGPAAPVDGTLLAIAAHGEATRTPDIARLSAGVVTRAADADAAMRANATQMARVVAALRAAGVAPRDVQTTGINLNPSYQYRENQPPSITGYEASNTVSLVLRDVARVGRVLDTLVAVGANQINGPSFDLDRRDEALDEARRSALATAQARAELYAKAVGMRVRRIVSIREGAGPVPLVSERLRVAAAPKAMADTPVAPGENTLGVDIDIVFELGR